MSGLEKKKPVALGNELYLIDGYDLGFEGRTGTYVCNEKHTTLIETGPSPSIPHVLAGLSELGIRPEEVAFIILTHIHLDHAGGAGVLVKECPNAEVIVHKKGKRHLADPSRLVKGARMVYGEVFDQLFNPVLPVSEEKLVVKEEGETLKLSDSRTLTFYDSPGHAGHHLAVYDSRSRGVFTGDTAGIRYHQVEDRMDSFFLPTTSPNQFDPDLMISSIEKIESLDPKHLYFGHFGATDHPEQAFDQVKKWIPVFVSEAKDALEQGEGIEVIQKRLHLRVSEYLAGNGVPDDHPVYQLLQLDFEVCAMGLADYLQKQKV